MKDVTVSYKTNREFKGVWFPAIVYQNTAVSWPAKIIFLEIDSFTSKDRDCFFSNKYLADLLHCSVAQITRYIRELKDIGWIMERGFDGRKRYLQSCLASSKMIRQDDQDEIVSPIKNDEHTFTQIPIPINTLSDSNESVTQIPLLGSNTEYKKKENKKKKESHPAYAFCIDFWLKEFHPNWNFNGSEGKALNELIAQMDKYFLLGHDRSSTAEEIVNFFKHLCNKLPEFYKSKNLRIINQNFDGIITEIKNGKRKDGFNGKNSHERFSDFAGV